MALGNDAQLPSTTVPREPDVDRNRTDGRSGSELVPPGRPPEDLASGADETLEPRKVVVRKDYDYHFESGTDVHEIPVPVAPYSDERDLEFLRSLTKVETNPFSRDIEDPHGDIRKVAFRVSCAMHHGRITGNNIVCDFAEKIFMPCLFAEDAGPYMDQAVRLLESGTREQQVRFLTALWSDGNLRGAMIPAAIDLAVRSRDEGLGFLIASVMPADRRERFEQAMRKGGVRLPERVTVRADGAEFSSREIVVDDLATSYGLGSRRLVSVPETGDGRVLVVTDGRASVTVYSDGRIAGAEKRQWLVKVGDHEFDFQKLRDTAHEQKIFGSRAATPRLNGTFRPEDVVYAAEIDIETCTPGHYEDYYDTERKIALVCADGSLHLENFRSSPSHEEQLIGYTRCFLRTGVRSLFGKWVYRER